MNVTDYNLSSLLIIIIRYNAIGGGGCGIASMLTIM